jgi:hypothetical protein
MGNTPVNNLDLSCSHIRTTGVRLVLSQTLCRDTGVVNGEFSKNGSRAILFSHPPILYSGSTTEIGRLAMKQDESAHGLSIATLSERSHQVSSHRLIRDAVAHCENKVEVKASYHYADRATSTALRHAGSSMNSCPDDSCRLWLSTRKTSLMLSLNYPACVCRNMDNGNLPPPQPIGPPTTGIFYASRTVLCLTESRVPSLLDRIRGDFSRSVTQDTTEAVWMCLQDRPPVSL